MILGEAEIRGVRELAIGKRGSIKYHNSLWSVASLVENLHPCEFMFSAILLRFAPANLTHTPVQVSNTISNRIGDLEFVS